MGRTIRLLGTPSIEVDGVPGAGPRGRKPWALLALLVLTEQALPRQRLTALLFSEADDPMGALRWNLAELRRVLGASATIEGDPVCLRWSADTVVDVAAFDTDPGRWVDVAQPPGELLAGMAFPDCEAFEVWLTIERQRQAAAVQAVLREIGLSRLAVARPHEASRIAARLVEMNPYDESHHVLLVRSLAMAGDRRAAREASNRACSFLRRELGVEPSPAIRDATMASLGSPLAPALVGVAAARAQLEAGKAAIAAGSVDAGIECLRRGLDELRFSPEDPLLLTALCELGSALVHSVRGRDEEGASLLHEVVDRAAGIDVRLVAKACRELGFIDVQAGRRQRASRWLGAAKEHAATIGDDAEMAAILGVEGMNLSDQARYPEAAGVLAESVDRALQSGSYRQAAWSASILGRLHLLRGEYDRAHTELGRSLHWVRRERWLAFRPWPEAFTAELDLLEGRSRDAEEKLQVAFALACQLGDPCWEGVTARGLGLLEARADPSRAISTLEDACIRCLRWPDAYQWVHGYALDALCTVAAGHDRERARAAARDLADLASRTDMRELIFRAQRHMAALGAPGAAEAAKLVASVIDNPVLPMAGLEPDPPKDQTRPAPPV
ncbi:MAG: SARP family transcriptional regulator [Acidobacteriota bacterium]|nr:SARP family transcriptional regulator [Acidobacteriota bacterium]